MAKFKKDDKVRVKDNPTKGGGRTSRLNPGDIVIVLNGEPDCDGDITVYPEDSCECNWEYIHEDSVEPVSNPAPELTVGDRVRAYNKRTEITIEGVVREIEEKDNHKWLWIGKGHDIAADLNNPDGYEFEILERAFKWPDHEGFIQITSGPHAGQRGLARHAIYSDRILIDTDAGDTLYGDTVAGKGFNFEYVEG